MARMKKLLGVVVTALFVLGIAEAYRGVAVRAANAGGAVVPHGSVDEP